MQTVNNFQINGSSPVSVGGTGVAAKYFPAPSGQINVTGTAPSATNAAGQLAVYGGNRLNGTPFRIIAAGNYEVGSGGACPNVLIEIIANTGSITTPTYTVLCSSGQLTPQNLTGVFYPWYFEATVQGDTQSGLLQGRYSMVADAIVEKNNVTLDNTLSKLVFGPTPLVNPNAPTPNATGSDPVFGLLVRVTYSVSEVGNAANMFNFSYES